MAALMLAVAIAAGDPPIDGVPRWRPLIAEASARFGVSVDRIERVMRAESAGRTTIAGAPIRSRTGAMGLMQLMPATWSTMREKLGLGADPDDPRDNILAGTAFLRLMQDRFGYPGMFAAYNMGPGGYARYLAGRATLPAETVAYLDKLTGRPARIAAAVASPRALLFVLRHDLDPSPITASAGMANDGLFAIRRSVP